MGIESTATYRRRMRAVTALTAREVQRLIRTADTTDIDSWWDRNLNRIERSVAAGHDTATRLTIRYLVAHATAANVIVDPEPVEFNSEQVATSLRFVGPTGFKRTMTATGSPEAALRVMTSKVPRAATRLALAGSRKTTENLVNSSQVDGYRRVTSATPCAFCAMLASRGGVYQSDNGHRFHDGCDCTIEPVYSPNEGPADPRLGELWREAKASAPDGVAAATQFRRLVEGRA